MWDDDFCSDGHDEAELFANSITFAAEKLIHELLHRRADVFVSLAEADFVTLLGMALKVFHEWMGPNEIAELWEVTLFMYYEHRKETEPKIKRTACEKLMAIQLPKWYEETRKMRDAAPKKRRPKKPAKRRSKKE